MVLIPAPLALCVLMLRMCVCVRVSLPVIDDRRDTGGDNSQMDGGHAAPLVAGAVNGGAVHYPRWFTISHIESRQCDLAATMLHAARGEHGHC